MLRLQTRTPRRATRRRDPEELADRIGAAKAELGLPADHPRPPLPAGRGHGLGRRPGRLVRPVPDRRRPDRGRVRRVLRRPLHGRVGRHPHRRPPAGASCPTSTPAARWPTWPTSTRSRRPGSPSAAVTDIERVVPVTYMNSSAALKAFVGRHGGVVCTSSNARAVLTWALGRRRHRAAPGRPGAVLPRPAPRAGTPASSSATARTTWPCGTPGSTRAASTTPPSSRPPCCCGRATARSTSGSARPRRRLPGRAPRRHRGRPSRVRPRGGRGGRPGRLHRLHHPAPWPRPRPGR